METIKIKCYDEILDISMFHYLSDGIHYPLMIVFLGQRLWLQHNESSHLPWLKLYLPNRLHA